MKVTTEPQAVQKPQTSSFLNGKAGEPFIQPKLTVNQPGDAYEQEADAMAERVMRMSDPTLSMSSAPIHTLQRKCAHCEEENNLQRKETSDSSPAAPSSVQQTLNQSGQPLSAESRSFFQPRFGQDFSGVRIHTDGGAANSARQINALAYTSGQNVVFGSGQYQPESETGKRLLAHELTHVVQQNNSANSHLLQRSTLTDDEIDIEAFEMGLDENDRINETSNELEEGFIQRSCPQGKQSKVIHNDCTSSGGPIDKQNFIESLVVTIATQNLQVRWNNGRTENWLCSPNPSHTPKGDDVVGVKCSVNHTNQKKDGMAWFTGFQGQGLRIGFHNSQRVAIGAVSHGCVRVSCDQAKRINQHTWSGRTTIKVV